MADEKKKVLMVIAFMGFKDEELFEPKKVFEDAGMEVTITSNQKGTAISKAGKEVKVDINYNDVAVKNYDAVVFVGGPGAEIFLDDEQAQHIARTAAKEGKVLAAICIAPSILANADLLENKKATAFSSEQDNLEEKGAIWEGGSVVVDAKIVTADGPDSATEFGKKIVELVSKDK